MFRISKVYRGGPHQWNVKLFFFCFKRFPSGVAAMMSSCFFRLMLVHRITPTCCRGSHWADTRLAFLCHVSTLTVHRHQTKFARCNNQLVTESKPLSYLWHSGAFFITTSSVWEENVRSVSVSCTLWWLSPATSTLPYISAQFAFPVCWQSLHFLSTFFPFGIGSS